MVLKIGIVGCGAIGKEIAQGIDSGEIPAVLVALNDRDEEMARELACGLRSKPDVLSIGQLAEKSDLVVEAASQGAVAVVAESALNAKADVMIMSVGALMDQGLRTKLFELAKKNDCRIHIPSGAVAGLDGLKAAGIRLRSISLTTTKPPSGLQGAPYVLAHRIPLFALKERTTIFEGPAEEAVRAFPANVNVAATLSLVCGVPVHVRIVADPAIKVNMHEISAEGEFGRMTIKVENVPSPANPKTSYLAALSAFATIRGLAGCVMIGT